MFIQIRIKLKSFETKKEKIREKIDEGFQSIGNGLQEVLEAIYELNNHLSDFIKTFLYSMLETFDTYNKFKMKSKTY